MGSRSGGSPPSRWSAGVGVGKAALGYAPASFSGARRADPAARQAWVPAFRPSPRLTNSPSGKRKRANSQRGGAQHDLHNRWSSADRRSACDPPLARHGMRAERSPFARGAALFVLQPPGGLQQSANRLELRRRRCLAAGAPPGGRVVVDFDGGLARRVRSYLDPQQALEAAGLPDGRLPRRKGRARGYADAALGSTRKGKTVSRPVRRSTLATWSRAGVIRS